MEATYSNILKIFVATIMVTIHIDQIHPWHIYASFINHEKFPQLGPNPKPMQYI